MNFTTRLKEKRLEHRLTQQEIADSLGVNRVTYTNWEKGSREPNLETIIKLTEILDTDTDYLLGKTNYQKQDWQPLEYFNISDIKNFSPIERDKLKFSIMLEITKNKITALELKNNLIKQYQLDDVATKILNSIFAEVAIELKEYFEL